MISPNIVIMLYGDIKNNAGSYTNLGHKTDVAIFVGKIFLQAAAL